MIEIPFTNRPKQKFKTVINSITYNFTATYNTRNSKFYIGVSNGSKTIEGIPLVVGVDLMSHYNIGLNNMYVVNLINNDIDPGLNDLGITSKVVIIEASDLG